MNFSGSFASDDLFQLLNRKRQLSGLYGGAKQYGNSGFYKIPAGGRRRPYPQEQRSAMFFRRYAAYCSGSPAFPPSAAVTGLNPFARGNHRAILFQIRRARIASAGSKPMIRSALAFGISGEWISCPIRTWLATQPPLCAIPIVSAVLTAKPRRIAASAISFDARTVPCPPTPHT